MSSTESLAGTDPISWLFKAYHNEEYGTYGKKFDPWKELHIKLAAVRCYGKGAKGHESEEEGYFTRIENGKYA